MNERFKQLAEQAGIEFTYDPTETPMRAFVECWEDEMQKFAELIIQECVTVVARANNPLGRSIDRLIDMHFGVDQ